MANRIKDSMSSFDIDSIIREIKPNLENRLIDNLYQIDLHIILLSFKGLKERLLLEAGRRLHQTSYVQKVPKYPPNFCQNLRKYLRRSRLIKLTQVNFDRIARLDFSTVNGEFSLFTEFFGKGNHILVNNDKKILHTLTNMRMRDRNVLRGEEYLLPPSNRKNIQEVKRIDLEYLNTVDESIIQQLTKTFNLGGLYAEEIVLRAGIDRDMSTKSLSENELTRIFDSIKSILNNHKSEKPMIVLDNNRNYFDVLPNPLEVYANHEIVRFQKFTDALDEYYIKFQIDNSISKEDSKFSKSLDKQRRILTRQTNQIKNLEESILSNQRIGKTIRDNAYIIQGVIEPLIQMRRSGISWNQILREIDKSEKSSMLRTVDSSNAMATISIDEIQFELDLRKSVYDNATTFFEKSKNSREKLEGLHLAIVETKRRMNDRLSIEPTIQKDFIPKKLRSREWFEKFHWFHSSEGSLVLGGRDVLTNNILLKRYAKPTDIMLHGNIPGSPLGLVESKGNLPSDIMILEAAKMVASYSRGWRSGLSVVDVYWVRAEQVSKTPPSGEYLPKGSFMMYGKRNYIKNVPLRIAVGIKEINDRVLVIGGPPSAIASQVNIFVEIIPGRIKTGELIKIIKSKLIRRVPENLKSLVEQLPNWEFQVFIPGGNSRIIEDS